MNVLDVSCPDCGVRKRQPCVYIQPKAPAGTAAYLAQAARAGTPTKRPHTGRYTKAYWFTRAAERKARRARYAENNAAGAEREAILRANAQAVAAEQHELIEWLRQYASILT